MDRISDEARRVARYLDLRGSAATSSEIAAAIGNAAAARRGRRELVARGDVVGIREGNRILYAWGHVRDRHLAEWGVS